MPNLGPDLKLLIPMVEDLQVDGNLVQVNFKVTHHRAGNRSSLKDLSNTNAPLKCSNWRNILSLASEHEAVAVNFKVTNA